MEIARELKRHSRFVSAILAAALLTASGNWSSGVWAEIPAGRELSTGRDFEAQYEKYFHRVILEQYLANRAKENPAAGKDDPAEEFLRLWIVTTKETIRPEQTAQLIEKGKRAIDAGCKDPIVMYCYGRSLGYSTTTEESVKFVTLALENFEKNGYANAHCSAAAKYLAAAWIILKRQEEADKAQDLAVKWMSKTVYDGPYEAEEQRLLYDHLQLPLETYPVDKMKLVVEQIDEQLYPWLKHVATADLAVREAWKSRGGGWAQDVSEDGWKGFAEQLLLARDNYYEAWKMAPHWPEGPTGLITVTMGGHGFEDLDARHWFDHAVAAQFDYAPAYNKLMWALSPRWGGSHGELYWFGRECLATGRFDTLIPYKFMEVFHQIVTDIGSSNEYYKAPGLYDDFVNVVDGYLKEPSMAHHHDWFRAIKVGAAVRCEQWDEAKKALEAAGDTPNGYGFGWFGLDMEVAIAEILARTGENGKVMAEADRLAAAGEYGQAKEKYETLAANTDTEQRVVTYFRGRVRELEFDTSYDAGKWTALPMDGRLTGWRNYGGTWSLDDEGRLVGKTHENGLKLVYDKQLGSRFELRGKAVVLERPYHPCNVGVYFGQQSGKFPNSFRWFLDGDTAAVLHHEKRLAETSIDIARENTFRISRWDNAITGYVNDKLIASDVEIEPYGPPESELLAFGGRFWYTGCVIRFEGLEIRKLTEKPNVEAPAAEKPVADSPAAENAAQPEQEKTSEESEAAAAAAE